MLLHEELDLMDKAANILKVSFGTFGGFRGRRVQFSLCPLWLKLLYFLENIRQPQPLPVQIIQKPFFHS
jgi:hypothetical protein